MQTEEIDVTLNPLSPTGPWTNGLPSTEGWQCPPATATAIATLPFVVGTGVLLEAACVEGAVAGVMQSLELRMLVEGSGR